MIIWQEALRQERSSAVLLRSLPKLIDHLLCLSLAVASHILSQAYKVVSWSQQWLPKTCRIHELVHNRVAASQEPRCNFAHDSLYAFHIFQQKARRS